MCSQSEVRLIINELCDSLSTLFPRESFDIILFGSYARNEAEDGSDIDVMFLVDASRQAIAEKHWQIGEAAADLLMEHGIVISPIVENRDYFNEHIGLLPFYRNIQQEGVRIGA
ncbi:MAG: nucleotidyltransferase domain-containing protein [Clostridia bacterium]|nr:nucleotidyltransferase domain-containing protein [Clostridia bacterium]